MRMITGMIKLMLCWCCISTVPASGALAAETDTGIDYRRWGRVLVMPVYDMTAIYGKDASLRGPLSRQVFVTAEVLSEADLYVNRLLERKLAKKGGLKWEPATSTAAKMPLNPSISREDHLGSISALGRRKGADYVLMGYLYAFRQRDGGNYGASTPAKVVLELVLVRTATLRIAGQKRYDETQQALSDNLLNLGKFIRRKGRWVTAHEMADQAVADMLDGLLDAGPPPAP